MRYRERLDETFAALAHPTRRAILARLMLGDASLAELAAPFKTSIPSVSKHLLVLERAGLISRGPRGQCRPCRITARPLREASLWIEGYRRAWEKAHVESEYYEQTGS